jgi:hypothetical protein
MFELFHPFKGTIVMNPQHDTRQILHDYRLSAAWLPNDSLLTVTANIRRVNLNSPQDVARLNCVFLANWEIPGVV